MSKDEPLLPVAQRRPSTLAPIAEARGSAPARRGLLQGDIGFVGLGRMGAPMAKNLADAGHRVIAYVRRPERMGRLLALGLKPTTDFSDLFDCEVVVSMLPDDAAVRESCLAGTTSVSTVWAWD
jgi:phosphoglycerate dehydrogenase-like enzyme